MWIIIILHTYYQCGCSRWCIVSNKISDTEQMKRVLIDCSTRLSQDTLNRAIDQLPKSLAMVIKETGRHVEFRLD